MPAINIVKCNNCGVSFPSGWGGYTYATSNDGRRVVCPHPGESAGVKRITGMEWDEAKTLFTSLPAKDCADPEGCFPDELGMNTYGIMGMFAGLFSVCGCGTEIESKIIAGSFILHDDNSMPRC